MQEVRNWFYINTLETMNLIAIILLGGCSLTGFSQTIEEIESQIENVFSESQIDDLSNQNPHWTIGTIDVNPEDTDVDDRIRSLQMGEVVTIEEGDQLLTYKFVNIEVKNEFRVSHVYLNGGGLSISQIDSIRSLVIREYESGIEFSELAKMHSSYQRPNDGDLGWFGENVMVIEFENAVREHAKGDLFILDIPSNNWYYVVLKTFDDRVTETFRLLRVLCKD